ncbi:MAG: hypothetical protein AB9891_06185 [Anaerolineaceae bacterium]
MVLAKTSQTSSSDASPIHHFLAGSILSRKRTSLFEVRENGLAYLTDLPNAGDTAYVG